MAQFFSLGRLLGAICGSSCACCRSWPIFACLGPLRARFRRDSGRSGKGFGDPRAFFLKFFCSCELSMRKYSRYAKTTIFPRFLYGFYTLQALCSSHKATRKRCRGLSFIASCKDCAQNASWGGFWEGLAHSEAPLGRLLFALGRLLASLGCFLGVS